MKPDQERVKTLLTDTIILLCQNGLCFTKELKVQGLLGITLDSGEIFLVQINETVSTQADSCLDVSETNRSVETDLANNYNEAEGMVDAIPHSPEPSRQIFKTERRRARRHRASGPHEVKHPETSFNNSNASLNNVIKSEVITMDSDDSSDIMLIMSNFEDSEQTKADENLIIPMESSQKSRRPTRRSDIALLQLPSTDDAHMGKIEPSFLDIGNQSISSGMQHISSSSHFAQNNDQFVNNAALGMENQCGVNFDFMGLEDPTEMEHLHKNWTSTSQSVTETNDADRKSFVCEFSGCGLSFYHSYTLYRHQRIKHGRRFGTVGQMSFFCTHPGCGRIFYRELALIKHERSVHGHSQSFG